MKQATFVVHGVGEPKSSPSDVDPATVAFAQAWGRSHRGIDLKQTKRSALVGSTLVDYHILSSKGDSSGNSDDHHIVELQWADLSTLWGGKLSAVFGLFSLIIGLRHVASAAGRALPAGCGWARWLARAIFWLMRRPILALNWALVAALLVAVVSPWTGMSSDFGVTLTASALISSPLLFPTLRAHRLAQWAGVLGAATATMPYWPESWLLGLVGATGPQRSIVDYYVTLGMMLNICWLLAALGSVVLLVGWLFGRGPLPRAQRVNFDALVLVPLLAIRVWSFGIPILWSGLLWLARKATGGAGHDAVLGMGALKQLTRSFIPMMGLNWVLLLMVVLAFSAAWHRFSKESTREGETGDGRATTSRLLVAPVLVAAVFGTTLAADTFMLAQLGGRSDRGAQGKIVITLPDPPWFLNRIYEYGLTIGVALAAIVFWRRRPFQAALDFAVDFTNYFRPPGRNGQSIPQAVAARFRAIVDDVRAALAPDRIVFVAHSQGTVYVGEFLRNGHCPGAELVTMGSPISHLYTHYFGGAFWNQGPPVLEHHVRQWVNLFRWSDYIGRAVDGCPNNVAIGPGGHTDYFGDDQVMKQLKSLQVVP